MSDNEVVEERLAERRQQADAAMRAEIEGEVALEREAERLQAENLAAIEKAAAAGQEALEAAGPVVAQAEAAIDQLMTLTKRLQELQALVARGQELQVWGTARELATITLPSRVPVGAEVITDLHRVANALGRIAAVARETATTRAMQKPL